MKNFRRGILHKAGNAQHRTPNALFADVCFRSLRCVSLSLLAVSFCLLGKDSIILYLTLSNK